MTALSTDSSFGCWGCAKICPIDAFTMVVNDEVSLLRKIKPNSRMRVANKGTDRITLSRVFRS